VPVKKTRIACRITVAIISSAPQWWTLRSRLATGIDSISFTLAKAAGYFCPLKSTSLFEGT